MRGKLICLDGFEGAGKTTRATALQATLESEYGRVCQVVREPGGDVFAEKLRKILKHGKCEITALAEVLAFNAARANMLECVVAPKLAEGIDVICDRSFISTLTYQGHGNDLADAEMDQLRQICQIGIKPAAPDLIVILNVSYTYAMLRKGKRGEEGDRFEDRPEEYLERVIKGFRIEAKLGGYPTVNADETEAVVDREILKHVLPILN